MCPQGHLEKTTALIVDNRPIYPLGENPDVPKPPKHNKTLRLLRRRHQHIHNFRGGHRRTTLPPTQKVTTSLLAKNRLHHATSMRSCQLNTLAEDYTPRYQTLKYRTP